ncbi:hypothetical protein PCANB_002480 [Pneumocystis canis]|nr:hypothetical protein PCANB_002480 [Pneumocystis canis]
MKAKKELDIHHDNTYEGILCENLLKRDLELVDIKEETNNEEIKLKNKDKIPLKTPLEASYNINERKSKRIKSNTSTILLTPQSQVIEEKNTLKQNKNTEKIFKNLEREKERALKAFLKEEEKKRKEEEKRLREEEKRLKEEERIKKKAEKDAKQQEKNEAKKKKESEVEKKQNSQLKLQSFFHTTLPKEDFTEVKDCFVSDYEKCFIPFFIKQHTSFSNQHAFVQDLDKRITIMKNMDIFLNSDFPIEFPIKHLLSFFKVPIIRSSRSSQSHITIKSIIQKYNQFDSTDDLLNELKIFPMKLLQFREDVRPPYYGTFSKSSSILTPRNPFKLDENLFNYYYDSEAEWIEEEEGEDINSMDDNDEEDDTAMLKEDEYDRDFLDDDDDESNNMKGKVITNLVPSIKGIYWQDTNDINIDDYKLFNKLKMDILIDIDLPINPYQDYWSSKSCFGNNINTQNSTEKTTSSTTIPPKAPLNFPQDSLPSFLKIIQGSTQTKVLLVETLRQKFTDISKQAIQWKLSTVAKRNGKGVNDTWAVDPSVWYSVFGEHQNL